MPISDMNLLAIYNETAPYSICLGHVGVKGSSFIKQQQA